MHETQFFCWVTFERILCSSLLYAWLAPNIEKNFAYHCPLLRLYDLFQLRLDQDGTSIKRNSLWNFFCQNIWHISCLDWKFLKSTQFCTLSCDPRQQFMIAKNHYKRNKLIKNGLLKVAIWKTHIHTSLQLHDRSSLSWKLKNYKRHCV